MWPRGSARITLGLAAGALAAALLTVAPASAATSAKTLRAERASAGACTGAVRGDDAVARMVVRSRGVAMVSARLTGAGGNWDLAVFDAAGDVVAGSAFADGDEIAQGFANTRRLTIQACRVSGSDPTARLQVQTRELTEPAPTMQLVRVATPTDADKDELVSIGLDLTEHGGPGFVDVVLHGPADGALLRERGFDYQVVVADLLQQTLADRAAERRIARRGGGGLPSGRTGTYRRLFDYSQEMQALAAQNPNLVRYFTLPYETYEGRPVEAIEVAPKVKRRDGRPTFLMVGLDHAREWPAGEHTLEFAYDLVNGWKQKNRKIRRLMRRARVLFVPVANPDGFNVSREAGQLAGAAGGRDGSLDGDLVGNLLIPYEYQRKNCRFLPPQEDQGGSCTQVPSTGLAQFGVDTNRNYGAFWGGPGASSADTLPYGPLAQNYRGPAPFSEPETRNVKWLVSRRQVTTLITNHTVIGLILRPPGLASHGPAPDEKQLKRLGDAMAAKNGYISQLGYQLYDTSGTTKDWVYTAIGAFGFTFELGGNGFHSVYQGGVVDEYLGNTAAAGDGGGNRAAYLLALRSTINRKRHALIRGRAPKGAILTLTKRFRTPSSPVIDGSGAAGEVVFTRDRLRTTLKVGRKGSFRWHVNPSTRPLLIAAKKALRARRGKPSDPITFSGDGTTSSPCGDSETTDPSCWNDHPFTVPGGKGVDNGQATVRITWPTPVSDWDMKVFRDSNGDGSSEDETELVGASAAGGTTVEETTFARPTLRRGRYVVRVINYTALEAYEGRIVFNETAAPAVAYKAERWRLTCKRSKQGEVLARRRIRVERGQRVRIDLRKACRQ